MASPLGLSSPPGRGIFGADSRGGHEEAFAGKSGVIASADCDYPTTPTVPGTPSEHPLNPTALQNAMSPRYGGKPTLSYRMLSAASR